MEVSPYLQAIQEVAGSTPGEKFKTLNLIARKTIDQSADKGIIDLHPSSELPAVLIPLVKLEIAKILKLPEVIIDALKADDIAFFHRALRATWFFDGSMKQFTNAEYFQAYIFPYLSLDRRIRVIKALALYLRSSNCTDVAEAFYLSVTEIYEESLGMPLLLVCSEPFKLKMITTRGLILSNQAVEFQFKKYPQFILNYLKLSTAKHVLNNRSHHIISIRNYVEFLPQLVKNHTTDLIELVVKRQSNFGLILNPKHTNMFLKTGVEALLANPILFMPMLSLKVITSKLSKEQFRSLFLQLRPKEPLSKMSIFSIQLLYGYLKYYPEQERTDFFLSVFKELYGQNYLECYNLVIPEIMKDLPKEQRIEYARLRFKSVQSDYSISNKYTWECYLPAEESIAIIKSIIVSTSESYHRYQLFRRMFYTCRVNNDEQALLKVLEYISIRHKNEPGHLLVNSLNIIQNHFEIHDLSLDHWIIMKKLLIQLRVRNELKSLSNQAKRVLMGGIKLLLIHDQPINEELEFLLAILSPGDIWALFDQDPVLEMKYIDQMIQMIASKLPERCNDPHQRLLEIEQILRTIYNFNDRHSKNKGFVPLSAENYSWVVHDIERFLITNHFDQYGIKEMKSILKNYDPKLYKKWVITDSVDDSDITSMKVLMTLKKNRKSIIDQSDVYYIKCKDLINHGMVRNFIKKCRWYEELPLKFAQKCFTDFKDTEDYHALIFLALLIYGTELEAIITPLTPTSPVIDLASKDADKVYGLRKAVMVSFNVANPMLPLETYLQYWKGDNIRFARMHMGNLKRRGPTNKVLDFAKALIENQPVSIKKHGIRLLCELANINQLQDILANLWETEKHRSIRPLIYQSIRKALIKKPCLVTWTMMVNCLNGLSLDDKDIYRQIINFNGIDNQYVVEYFKKLMEVFRRLSQMDPLVGHEKFDTHYYIQQMLAGARTEVGFLFPEELHQEILQTYFADFRQPTRILDEARKYCVYTYILPAQNKLESRLNYYANILTHILKTQWNIPHPDDLGHYPANWMMYSSIDLMIKTKSDIYIFESTRLIQKTLEAFNSVLKPQQAPSFYLTFTFSNLLDSKDSVEEITDKVSSILPSLIEIFSLEFMNAIAQSLSTILITFYGPKNSVNITLKIVKLLIELNDELTTDFAVTIFFELFDEFRSVTDNDNPEYTHILQFLLQSQHPVILSKFSMRIESRGPQYGI